MRLDQELVRRGSCESRTEAQELIGAGFVVVNGVISRKQIQKVSEADAILVTGRRTYVSRGGEKLRGVLRDIYGDDEAIQTRLQGKIALDIGSSTGGFSDCLLSYGIAHVDAVDVGTGQLHPKLRGDGRVSLFENTDIRTFTSGTLYDIVVADLSFISLEAVLDTVVSFGKAGTDFFLLIKPQFEVGRGNTKKGIVKDEGLVVGLLKRYEVLAKMKGMATVTLFPCHLQGGDGNQEFFLAGTSSRSS
jgi:23S rRNA (cytidine1920-2'-O)/16S rRNA (cytidine1409-2'-O)-methyltransferase